MKHFTKVGPEAFILKFTAFWRFIHIQMHTDSCRDRDMSKMFRFGVKLNLKVDLNMILIYSNEEAMPPSVIN